VLERTGTFLDPGNHALMDRHLRQASVAAVQTGASDPGCLGALGRLLAAATARVAGTAGEGAYAVAGDVEAGAATKAKKASKLELAVAAVEGRVTELQQRAVDLRAKAKELGVAGQKAAALQALKRARAIDAQAATASASALALERQVDMIEQAQVRMGSVRERTREHSPPLRSSLPLALRCRCPYKCPPRSRRRTPRPSAAPRACSPRRRTPSRTRQSCTT